MSEYQLHELWRYGQESEQPTIGYQKQFEALFKQVYDLPECVLTGYFNEVQIQHVPRYAYGEEIAVLVERGRDRLSLSRSYNNFTERLVKLIGPWEEPNWAASEGFDVLLAHNNAHKLAERVIAQKLRQRGIKLWLDEEQVPPGRRIQETIQQALPEVQSVALLIGQNGEVGKWQAVEMHSFISQAVEAGLPVIPVLLPHVDDIPKNLSFLKSMNWVRFANGVDDSEALDKLEWGITGKKPQRARE